MRTTRTWIYVTAFTVLLILIFGTWHLYSSNMSNQTHDAAAAVEKAKQHYSFDRTLSVSAYHGSDAYQVVKAKRNGKTVYFWVPDDSKKAAYIERRASDGITKNQVLTLFERQRFDVKRLISVRLGAINGNPVWEITFLSPNQHYNYVSFYFDSGKEAQRILNL
ncbi:cell wall elongation regulator TseB-like domain-containing protein [Sporolactobacillus terrae]|uniref:cell wall elongation regulator TseB-like domain-containing protein n=1 Tax=Sporolactobacillus terrae TaxID=269673 RepID=UPI00159BE88B|nr:DUF5590 domain-containing protein [Sporolactobacillus terrae]